VIKDFREYLDEGIVLKVSVDKERSKNLILESERKYSILFQMIKNMGIDDDKANDYVEYCYNILIYLIRAKMLLDGFHSSGKGAHEAEVSYFRIMGFTNSDVNFLDQLRYFRNGILYYGKRFDKEYAQKVIDFTKEKYLKLKSCNLSSIS